MASQGLPVMVTDSKAGRRPPQTMADIPYSTRRACADFIRHLEYMLSARAHGEPVLYWEDLDEERRSLHERLMVELKKIGISVSWAGEAEQIARDIDRRRWRAKKSMSIKARRPAQTMADIPHAVRKAAKDYIDQIEFMEEWGEDWKASKWNREDEERRELHDRFLDTLRGVGITWRSMDDSQRIAIAITKGRWRAKKSGGLKARRPAQTMADIPFALRKAAKEYIWHLDSMQDAYTGVGDEEQFWEDLDIERRSLHQRLLKELRKVGIAWRTRGESEDIAQAIDDRRWRAKKSASRDRLIDRLALKLASWKSANLVLTFRRVAPFESMRRHIRDLEWAGARVTGSGMLLGHRGVGEVRVTVSDVAEFVRRFKRTRSSDYWRERWEV